jgi:hypothetical protein
LLVKAQSWFRRWFTKVWRVRGGGLYACGYAITFVALEVTTVVGELVESTSIGNFLSEQLVEFIFRFVGDSMVNLLMALMWPVYIVQWQPPFGAIGLGLAYIVFAKYLKKPISDWLLSETENEP